jgi:hypothetical protein
MLDQADRASVTTPVGSPAVQPVGHPAGPLAEIPARPVAGPAAVELVRLSEGTPAGPDQGVIEEARRRQRLRRVRMGLGGLLAVLGLGGLVWGLGAWGPSAHPAHAHGAAGVAGAAKGVLGAAGFDVHLSPALDGGQYGWCVGVEEHPALIAYGACAMTPVASTPLAMQLSGASAGARQETIVVLVTPQVRTILVNGGRRVPTLTLPGLPYGLRAARVLIALRIKTHPDGRRSIVSIPQPKLVALDARGRVIADQVREIPALSRSTLVGAAATGPCRLRVSGLPGLRAKWSHVAAAIRPFPGALVGRSFFSCVDTEYYLHNWPLDAAVLLDAAHPGTSPAAIPGLEPVRGQRGYFNGPGDFKGELTATRVGNSWLVLAGGSGLAQRLEILRHLTATVKL